MCVKTCSHNCSAYISKVLGVGEVGQVSVVELLAFQVVTVLARPQIAGFDAIGLKELLVGHTKCLANRLRYDLSLYRQKDGKKTEIFLCCAYIQDFYM